MSLSQGSITYGKRQIKFNVLYVNRKTLEIAVLPDRQVVVKAPIGSEWDKIQKKIIKRARWISRQLEYFRQFEPRTPARQYVGGESHLYLGRHYRLKVHRNCSAGVKLTKGFCQVSVTGKSSSREIKAVLDEWYFHRASAKFIDAFERCWNDFNKRGVSKPRLFTRRMKTRWGSLAKSGALTLNTDLVRAPLECIEYVITHELCHLKHHDHSSGFYKLLEKVMPDWEKRKRRLEMALV